MSNLQKYGTYEIEVAEEEQEDLEQGAGIYLKLSEGRHELRFLPPKLGVKSPFVTVYQHFLPAPPGAKRGASFACPRLMAPKGQPRSCIVCKKMEELKSSPNPVDQDLAQDISANRRVFANVIDRKHPDRGPLILGCGKMIHEALTKIRTDEAEGGDFTDPGPDGFDIIITRTGTDRTSTKYDVKPSRKCSELGNMDWIDQQHDLVAEVAQVPTDEQIAQALGLPVTAPGGRRTRRNAASDAMGGTEES